MEIKKGVCIGGLGTRYSKEFKAEAVVQVIECGYSVLELAKRVGVSDYSLCQWVNRPR